MSITIFGEYFTPMSIPAEILYYTGVILVGVFVLRNLYLAIRAPWKPQYPEERKPSRSRITSEYLNRAGIACCLLAYALSIINYYIS